MNKKNTTRGTKYKYKDILFASIYEARVAQALDTLGLQWEYEPVSLPWQPTIRTRYYTPDFLVKEKDGTEYFLEAKGYFEQPARTKMLAIRKQYPELDIRFSFMQPRNKIGKLTYPEWAEKRGYGVMEFDLLNDKAIRKLTRDELASSSKEVSVETPIKTSKSRTQLDSTTRRSTRTKAGTIQGNKKSRTSKTRSTASMSLCS